MEIVDIRHSEFLPDGTAVQLTRAALANSRPKMLHQHDFYELLWVQNGKIRHYKQDGTQDDLTEGALIFVPPTAAHAIQGRGKDAMIVSVAFAPQFIGKLGRDYPDLDGHFFWDAPDKIAEYQLSIQQLATLNHAAVAMERRTPNALTASALLVPLLTDLLEDVQPIADSAPAWLITACHAVRDPEVFRDGAAGFVRVSGRAHAHVSRTCRQHLKQSPSEYVNRIRMEYAARQLVGSSESLGEIAAECGIPNLSHFHKLFLAHHGQTPAQFRRARQRNVIQPAI